ncbi:hypothetical protein [Halospeciosus flavus]|uniref:hypothetical protein n=1 Tax=Halospeciosus flavus TaxID=3032283 RepID=UPI003624630C
MNDTDQGEVVRLAPVTVQQALSDLSAPVSSPLLADAVRRAVREGSATTHDPLPDDSTGRVVEHDGQFYVVQRVAGTGGWDPVARTIALTTLVVVGALSIVLRRE